MKNIFEVNEEEKSRILNLHESATKKQYLSEQEKTNYDVAIESIGKINEFINYLAKNKPEQTDKNYQLYPILFAEKPEVPKIVKWAQFEKIDNKVIKAIGDIVGGGLDEKNPKLKNSFDKVGTYFKENSDKIPQI